MRSLSLKVFFWFWLALAVAGSASLAVAMFFPSQTLLIQAKQYFTYKLTNAGRTAVEAYEEGGREGLAVFMRRLEQITSFHLYLLSDQGEPLRAAALPPGTQDLARRALTSTQIQVQGWFKRPLAAAKITGSNGRAYVVVLEMPMGLAQYLAQISLSQVLRFLAALAASGLACFYLARYLTAPIRNLRSAVRKFARGDLSVRVAPAMGKRRDEIADLGQDFDMMAGRIESLMQAHERLLRDVAHELRSPLTRLNVALEIMRKQLDGKAENAVNRIAHESDHLSRLITQLLTLSRFEHAAVKIEPEAVVLETLVAQVARDADFEGQTRNCCVTFTVETPCALQADARLLHSTIENVVRNALRFAPDGSQVTITQSVLEQDPIAFACIRVQDQGPGVPEKALNDLFQPFFRVRQKHSRAGGGAGLGLAIAYHAVHLHHGRICAQNHPSGGLVVEISLPLNKSTTEHETAECKSEVSFRNIDY